MPFEQIIAIVAFFLVLVFVWGIFKKLFKLMFYAGIIIFLLLAANLYFIYQDFKDLRENFAVSDKKVILKDDDKILTGLLLNEDTNLIADRQLKEYSSNLKNNNYEYILGGSYRLMIFDVDIISDLDNVELDGAMITADEAISILKSNDSAPQEKAALFSVILADEILTPENPLFFLFQFKEGNIAIYPETALFKTLRVIPVGMFKDAAKSLFAKTKEKAEAFIVEEDEQ